jgi:NADPH-dependent curcumin reductase CurA
MNAFSRIAVCGLIAQYNSEPYPMKNIGSVLVNRIKMQGFIVSEHMERWPVALPELGQGVATGKIKYRETVAKGLENAPAGLHRPAQGRQPRQATGEADV